MRNRYPFIIFVALGIWLATIAAAVLFRGRLLEAQSQLADLERERSKRVVAKHAAPPATEMDAFVPAVKEVDDRHEEEIASLNARIRELEDELVRRNQASVAAEAAPLSSPQRENGQPRERRNWMEELRRNDPQGYEEFQKRREEARQVMQDSLARKAAYLLYKDADKLSKEEQERQTLMMNLLSETWSLFRQMPGLPHEQRFEAMRTLRDHVRTLEPMLDQERERAFYMVGRDLGYNEEDAARFAQHMDELVDVTTLRDIRLGPGFGGPPRR